MTSLTILHLALHTYWKEVWTGAIIRDGDRKRAPFLVLGLAPWYGTIFLFLEQIAPSPRHTRKMRRGFLRMTRRRNGVQNSRNLLCFWPTIQRIMSVGILLQYFRRKFLQFEWSKTVLNLGMSRFITDQVVFRCFFYKNFTILHSKFYICKRLTAFL